MTDTHTHADHRERAATTDLASDLPYTPSKLVRVIELSRAAGLFVQVTPNGNVEISRTNHQEAGPLRMWIGLKNDNGLNYAIKSLTREAQVDL